VFDGAIRVAVLGALRGGRRWHDRAVTAYRDATGCADEHRWDRVCTTVMAGRPLVVEYRCRRCRAWTVEERLTW
jgi:hypothetical protein